MVSAKVNGKAVKLDYKIQTGDMCKIKTQAGKKSVKADWLNMLILSPHKVNATNLKNF
jgi:GTP pyrophosphokinase